MQTNTVLYAEDFWAWTQDTARLIRDGKWHDLDKDALAEEVESLGRSQQRELEHRLESVAMHLLKWCYQPSHRVDSHSWADTIFEQRRQIATLLRDNPSLRPTLAAVLAESYAAVRRHAHRQTRFPLSTFPATCPWTVAEILADDFWPEAAPPA